MVVQCSFLEEVDGHLRLLDVQRLRHQARRPRLRGAQTARLSLPPPAGEVLPVVEALLEGGLRRGIGSRGSSGAGPKDSPPSVAPPTDHRLRH